jgi:hypothetical protein
MANIKCSADTTLSEDQVRAVLTDFSSGRPEKWPNLDPDMYKVHDLGQTWADVTEGSSFAGGIWERTRYEWTDPHRVVLTVTDSNAFAPGSSWEYTTAALSEDGTRVDLVVDRRGRSAKGRFLASVLRVTGHKVFCGDLAKTLRGLERGN